MNALGYGLILVFGAFLGFVFLDITHLTSRYWIHNLYDMYLYVGCMVGLIFNICYDYMKEK